MKTKSELLQRVQELADMVAEMEAEKVSFASGDLVSVDGKVGQIESFDQDGNYTVRVYDENMEATDEVLTATTDTMTKYPPSDEPDTKVSTPDDESDEEETQEKMSNDAYKQRKFANELIFNDTINGYRETYDKVGEIQFRLMSVSMDREIDIEDD